MAERLFLDPSAVSTGRSEVEITQWVDASEGIDYGDAEIAAYMADRDRGSAPVDFRIPNRQITIPLVVKQSGSTTFAQARQLLQRKAALIQREGGWFGRVLSSNTVPTGGTVYADVVSCSLKLGGGWMQTHRNVDLDAELRLEVIPDWFGDERQLADHVDTSAGEVIWTETNIAGDYPGRLRLVVDNDSTSNMNGLVWGVRSRHYSASNTAKLVYEAEACTPLDAATITSGVVSHPSVGSSWTPVLSTNLAGNIALTHTGSYKVLARAGGVVDPAAPPVQLRIVWDVGDFALPTENDPVDIPNDGGYRIFELGTVRLDRVPAGTHRWQGVFQARSSLGGMPCLIDKFWLVPVDEGCGVLRAPVSVEPGLQGFVARDEFNQSAGALAGKAAPVGGAWAWAGTGSTNDFVVDATNKVALRTALSDVGTVGRIELCGTSSFATVAAQADVSRSTGGQLVYQSVVARYVSTTTFVRASLGSANGTFLLFEALQGNSVVVSRQTPVATNAGVAYTIRLWIDAQGNYSVWFGLAGGVLSMVFSGSNTAFATGGQLASGRVGIQDYVPQTTGAVSRQIDNFAAWVPVSDAVLFTGRSAELRTEGMFRQESTGTAYGPVSYVTGDLPRIPPSGVENRTVQFFVKGTRSDLGVLPDPGNLSSSARVTYRPSYLFVS